MKHPALLLPGLLTLAPAVASAGQSSPVIVGQELQSLRGNGVSSVQWTRRAGYYTLQVIYADSGNARASLGDLVVGSPTPAPAQLPQIQVWLLQPHGRYVEPLNRHQVTGRLQASVLTRGQLRNGPRMELVYRFALPDGADAEAVAIRVGNDLRIEKLLPLDGREPSEKI